MTRKSRNKASEASSGTFHLPKTAVLRGRDHFNHLFEQPDAIISEDHLSLRFYTVNAKEADCKMAFIAAKRLGKANKRNHLKRLLRESYRLHREPLTNAVEAVPCKFFGALIGKTISVDFKTLESETICLLNRTVSYLHSSRKL